MAELRQSNGKATEEPEMDAGTPKDKKATVEEEEYQIVSYWALFK
jgi:hypothetical protein